MRIFQAPPPQLRAGESILEFSKTEAETLQLRSKTHLCFVSQSYKQTCFECPCHAATRAGRSAPWPEPARRAVSTACRAPRGCTRGGLLELRWEGRLDLLNQSHPPLRTVPGVGIAASHGDGPSAE